MTLARRAASESRSRPGALPYAVGACITAAYLLTASTSLANPAVTPGRAASDTFAGIRPDDVVGLIAAQMIGAMIAVLFCRWTQGRAA